MQPGDREDDEDNGEHDHKHSQRLRIAHDRLMTFRAAVHASSLFSGKVRVRLWVRDDGEASAKAARLKQTLD